MLNIYENKKSTWRRNGQLSELMSTRRCFIFSSLLRQSS